MVFWHSMFLIHFLLNIMGGHWVKESQCKPQRACDRSWSHFETSPNKNQDYWQNFAVWRLWKDISRYPFTKTNILTLVSFLDENDEKSIKRWSERWSELVCQCCSKLLVETKSTKYFWLSSDGGKSQAIVRNRELSFGNLSLHVVLRNWS